MPAGQETNDGWVVMELRGHVRRSSARWKLGSALIYRRSIGIIMPP